MTSNATRIGILGAGGVAEAIHLPTLTQMPGLEVAWLCDQVPARAVKLAREWGIRGAFGDLRACPDVDVMLVAIPVGLRREALARAFERGWHVFVEKPFATSVEEHLGIVQEAARAGVQVGVGLMRRFFRSTALARLAVSRQAFGPVVEVWAAEAARMSTTGREGAWYQADRAAAGGGVLMETGSHLVDQVFQALGAEAFDGLRAVFTHSRGIDLEARAVANVKRAGAAATVPVHLVVSRIRDLYPGVVIRCERASIRIGADAAVPAQVLGLDDRPLCHLEGAEGGTNFYQPFMLEWQAFLAQCRSGVSSVVDGASALLGTRFIAAAYANGAGAA
ncbi:MAG: Gfo/Idh/MocA family protein [Burkholderiales bacterium]